MMESMRYKGYTWKYNPSRCTYSCDKTVASHKYPELNAVEQEDMGADAAILSCSGEFFGEDAYKQWDALNKVFREKGVGQFYHPLYRDIEYATMKRLESNIEPRPNYVAYTFEIWQHIPVISAVTLKTAVSQDVATNENTGAVVPKGTVLKVGSKGALVLSVQKKLLEDGEKLPKYGADGKFGTEMQVAVRAYQKKHGIKQTGNVGPLTLAAMGFVDGSTSGKQSTNTQSTSKVYTVKSGDTLSGIGAKYGIKWQTIAKYNGIKDPHKLKIGMKIKIPS